MRRYRWCGAIVVMGLLGVNAGCASAGGSERMFGKYARMREVAGEVIGTGTSWWGARYIVVKDRSTGLRVYLQSDAASCVSGRPFKGTGHLTRAEEEDYDATFHLHLTDAESVCG